MSAIPTGGELLEICLGETGRGNEFNILLHGCRLTTVGEVAAELGRLYRLTRWGQVPTQDASRLAVILSAMRQCLEASDLERQIREIQEALAQPAPSNVIPKAALVS